MDYHIKYSKYKLKYIYKKTITIPFNKSCDSIDNIINKLSEMTDLELNIKFVTYRDFVTDSKNNIIYYKDMIKLYHDIYKNINEYYIQLLQNFEHKNILNIENLNKLLENKNKISNDVEYYNTLKQKLQYNKLIGGVMDFDEFSRAINREIDTIVDKNDKYTTFIEFINEKIQIIETQLQKVLIEDNSLSYINNLIETLSSEVSTLKLSLNSNVSTEVEEIDFTELNKNISRKLEELKNNTSIPDSSNKILDKINTLETLASNLESFTNQIKEHYLSQRGGLINWEQQFKTIGRQKFINKLSTYENICKFTTGDVGESTGGESTDDMGESIQDKLYTIDYTKFYYLIIILELCIQIKKIVSQKYYMIQFINNINFNIIDYWKLFFQKKDINYEKFLYSEIYINGGTRRVVDFIKSISTLSLSFEFNINEDLIDISKKLNNTVIAYNYLFYIIEIMYYFLKKYFPNSIINPLDENTDELLDNRKDNPLIQNYISNLKDIIKLYHGNDIDIDFTFEDNSSSIQVNIDKIYKNLFDTYFENFVLFLFNKKPISEIEISTNNNIMNVIKKDIKSIDKLIIKIENKLGIEMSENEDEDEEIESPTSITFTTIIQELDRYSEQSLETSDIRLEEKTISKPRLDKYEILMRKCYNNLKNFKVIVNKLKEKIKLSKNQTFEGEELYSLLSLSSILKENLNNGINIDRRSG